MRHNEHVNILIRENQVAEISVKTEKYKIILATICCPPKHNQEKKTADWRQIYHRRV